LRTGHPPKEPLDHPITIVLSASMLAALERAAHNAGITSPRVYARSVLIRHLRKLGLLGDDEKST